MTLPPDAPILSVVAGKNNADLISEVARLYLPEGSVVADVTFGRGAFWRKTDTSAFTLLASDLEPELEKFTAGLNATFVAADFTALPYEDASVDVVVLDPPYVHSPGKHQTDTRYNNAATTKGFYYLDILDLYQRGMKEALRVLKPGGMIWIKCMDQVMSGQQRWAHIDIYQSAVGMGLYGRDLFVLVPSSSTTKGRWTTQHHARKVHSYLWVFENKTVKLSRLRKKIPS